MGMFMAQIVEMISCIFVSKVITLYTHVKHIQLLYVKHISVKWFNKTEMSGVKIVILRIGEIKTHLCVNANYSVEGNSDSTE